MRAPSPAGSPDRLPILVLRLALASCLLAAGCSRSAIGTVDDDLDSSTSPASDDLDGGVRVVGFDATSGARNGDAAIAADGARLAADGAVVTGGASEDGGCVGNSCQVFDCPDGGAPSICGCNAPDSDGDGTPDCADECPNDRNKKLAGVCGCGVSDQDTDLDGTPDCNDKCSGKPDQTYVPDGSCGVGYCRSHNHPSTCMNGVETQCKAGSALHTSDSTCDGVDDDCDGKVDEDYGMSSSSCGAGACAKTGTVSCVSGKVVDSCVAGTAPAQNDTSCDGIDDDCDGMVDEDYPTKASSCAAGACASTGVISCSGGKVVDSCSAHAPISSNDATCNNIDDDCDGMVDEDYKSSASKCGVGACASTGTISCSNGSVVNSCKPAAKPSNDDTSCNNVDDDCNGKVDDGFASTSTHCGLGVCAASGSTSCSGGSTKDSCTPGAPTSATDDAFAPGNGLDDDCDGKVDEDVPSCNTAPQTYEVGSYANIAVPGNCHSMTVSLWGGGGAGGQQQGNIGSTPGGAGGAGGYASATLLVNGSIALSVGGGAASGCNAAGTNAASSAYNGGSGGGGSGDDGGDGSASGGGNGGGPKSGQHGGDGHFGGGGGGAGNGGIIGSSGDGGGGGAATVLTINGNRAAVAGGGGGGGGAQGAFLNFVASRGGAGGSGCGADGQVETSTCCGGGGGGLCIGGTTQTGSGTTPAASNQIPGGRASGGSSSCNAGGNGYAIITFSP